MQSPGALNKKGKIVDNQPIVFHTQVKSSGYRKESPRLYYKFQELSFLRFVALRL